jgi:PAS domain S-box-containing protein
VRKLTTIKAKRRAAYSFRLLALLGLLAIPACFAVTTAAQTTSSPKGILVLYYYGKDYPANVEFEQGVLAALKSMPPGSFEYYPEYLEPNRFPGKLQSAAFQDYLRKKYADHRIDVTIAQTDIALNFLLQYRRDIFPNTPIVFFARKRPDLCNLPGEGGCAGVVADEAYQKTLEMALNLHPKTQRVYVVTSYPENDASLEAIVHEQLRPFETKVEIVYVTNVPLDEMLTRVRNAAQGSLILYVRYSQDELGKTLGPREILALVAQSANVPVYGIAEGFVGHGIVGGYLFRQEDAGQRLGEMALQIAAGKETADIPTEKARLVPMFDWRQLRRWNIPEGQLPAGSVVRFKEPSVWELYKWRIVGVISLFVLEAVLIVGLLINRVRRRQAEKDNARLARLAEAERLRLDEVISNVPGIVWEVRAEPETRQRRAIFVSEYAEKMLGYSKAEWMSVPSFALTIVPEEDRERTTREAQAIFDSGKGGVLQYRWVTKDGRFLWVESQVAPIFDEAGKPVGLRGVTMDITERKAAEEALRAAVDEVSRLKNQLQEENIYLQEEIKLAHHVDEIIGQSNAINYVLFKIEQVAKTDSTVLILGETGTGKELVARAIHSQSLRKDRPLVKVNCAALSASLIESELFGHERGAFTGASARKIGRFELADGATLFLDEIGELPLELQSKLLRVIQEGEFERLGSSRTVKVDVRIIAATNRNMKTEIARGSFREDLWYRLNVFPITVPPLRQRREDIPAMIEHFVNGLSKKLGKPISSISSATLKKLKDYSWPGNVRELANVIERAVINAQGTALHIADQFEQPKPEELSESARTLEQVEKEYIISVLDNTGWRIEGPHGAAKILGLNPSTLRTRMVKLKIQKSIGIAAEGQGVS